MTIRAKCFWVVALLLQVAFLVALWRYYPELRDPIPTHYNFDGRADAWGSKSELWLSVVINWVGFVLCSVLLRYPQYYNYPRSVAEERLPRLHQLGQELMAWTILSITLLLLYPASCMLLVCPSMPVWIVFVGLSLTFGGMGYYFYKCYRLGD